MKAPSASSLQSQFTAPWIIFWAALIVRIAYMTLGHGYRLRVIDDHFEFGWEMGRIAKALATGYGFADPFEGHTGPTAWVPPLYPLIIAAAFKLFGVYTRVAAWFILAFNCVCSAATIPAIYEIATRCFGPEGKGRRIALWSAWLWALYPAAMQFAVRWIWDMSLTAMLFAWVLVLALRVRGIGEPELDKPGIRTQTALRWALFGALWGLIALSNSTLLVFLPVCGIWMLMGKAPLTQSFPRAVLAGIVFIAVISPWVVRNWRVFHAFIPMRDNFGAELYMGNGPYSLGMPWGPTLPVTDRAHLRRYADMGEVAYVKERGTMAKAYIASHPGRFLRMSVQRFYMYWAGVPHPPDKGWFLEFVRMLSFSFLSLAGVLGLLLALRRGIAASGLFAWAFLLLPLTYYFVTVQARFRHPLEPLICILGVYLFQSAEPKRSSGHQKSAR